MSNSWENVVIHLFKFPRQYSCIRMNLELTCLTIIKEQWLLSMMEVEFKIFVCTEEFQESSKSMGFLLEWITVFLFSFI